MKAFIKQFLFFGFLLMLTSCCRWWNCCPKNDCYDESARNPANCCPQPHLGVDKFCNPSDYDLN